MSKKNDSYTNHLDRCEAEWDQWQRKAATIGRSPPFAADHLDVGRGPKLVGEPWEPRSDTDLIELYEYYKQQRASASAHINRLRKLRDSLVQGFQQRRRISVEEVRRMGKLAGQMTRQMRSAEVGERYFAIEEARFLQKLQARGHYPHAVASRLPFSAQETRMIGDILRTATKAEMAGARVPLTSIEVKHRIQEQQKDLDIAHFELKYLRSRMSRYREGVKLNKRYWRQATARGNKNLQEYVDLDRDLAKAIRTTRQQIEQQKKKTNLATQKIKQYKRYHVLRSKAGLEPVELSEKSLKDRWRSWREKRKARKLRGQAHKVDKTRKRRETKKRDLKRKIEKEKKQITQKQRTVKKLEQRSRKL